MICADASIALKWILVEEDSVRARLLLSDAVAVAEPLVAPPLLRSEITNALRQRVRSGDLSLAEGRGNLTRFLAIPVGIEAPEELYDRALVIADEYGLPAAYDAHYIALAQLLGAELWTADRRLLQALGTALPYVHDLADYQAHGA